MKKVAVSMIIILPVLKLCACAADTEKEADIAVSAEISVDQSVESDSGEGTEAAEQEGEKMRSGLGDYTCRGKQC